MRLLQSLRRGNKAGAEVTEEELQTKLEELKTGMLLAFDYSQGESCSLAMVSAAKCNRVRSACGSCLEKLVPPLKVC